MKNFLLFIISCFIFLSACDDSVEQQKSDSGVSKATTTVKTDASGMTIEQKNIIERLNRDNEIGAIKHLYIISSYTGDVLQYSTVVGKVTSGGKRLSPRTVRGDSYNSSQRYSNWVQIGNYSHITDEVLDDGGAYGDSGNYMYWFDAQGNYMQYYPAGGTYVQISDKPLRIKKANFSVELVETPEKTK